MKDGNYTINNLRNPSNNLNDRSNKYISLNLKYKNEQIFSFPDQNDTMKKTGVPYYLEKHQCEQSIPEKPEENYSLNECQVLNCKNNQNNKNEYFSPRGFDGTVKRTFKKAYNNQPIQWDSNTSKNSQLNIHSSFLKKSDNYIAPSEKNNNSFLDPEEIQTPAPLAQEQKEQKLKRKKKFKASAVSISNIDNFKKYPESNFKNNNESEVNSHNNNHYLNDDEENEGEKGNENNSNEEKPIPYGNEQNKKKENINQNNSNKEIKEEEDDNPYKEDSEKENKDDNQNKEDKSKKNEEEEEEDNNPYKEDSEEENKDDKIYNENNKNKKEEKNENQNKEDNNKKNEEENDNPYNEENNEESSEKKEYKNEKKEKQEDEKNQSVENNKQRGFTSVLFSAILQVMDENKDKNEENNINNNETKPNQVNVNPPYKLKDIKKKKNSKNFGRPSQKP